MTHTFLVGDPAHAPSRDPATVAVEHDWAEVGPGGVQILLKRDAPSAAERRAVELGPVSLGVKDDGEPAVLLVDIGEPGRPGRVEGSVEVDPRTGWWGLDYELALCDAAGIVCAVRRFTGPDAEATPLWDAATGTRPRSERLHMAVFPDERYGLMQPRGDVTVDTVVEYGLALVACPEWRPGFTEVWDFRFAGGLHFSPFEFHRLRSLERHTDGQLEGSRTVVITANRHLLEWSARSYARAVQILNGRAVVPYDTAEEAARDLGVPMIPTLVGP